MRLSSFYRLSTLVVVAFVVLFSAGCDPDTIGSPGGVTLPPVVTLNSGPGLVSFNQEVPLATPTITVNVSGQDGDALLRSLLIQQNGIAIPANQLNFRTGQVSNNPILITGGDVEGFTYEIEITPSNPTAGDVEYSFVLTDADNEFATTSVTVTYTAAPPVVSLNAGAGFVNGDTTITSTAPSFTTQLEFARGDNDVTALEILENGVLLDTSSLSFNNDAFTPANPLALIGAEVNGAIFNIAITPNVAADETRTYVFRLTDAIGQQSEVSFTVTYVIPQRDLDFEMSGVFFNASGFSNGGLDLDTGTAVPFNSPDAEIEDEGIDLNTAGENWRAQVSATNDAVLRIANVSSLGENVAFADVQLKSDIARLFDQGSVPDGSDAFPDADGDTSREEIVTQQLRVGDVLAVRRGARTYLVRIDEVNFVSGSNTDSYMVSIKY